MVRIAKVKFNSGGEFYDYFCPNKKINEGDLVFVEGEDQPLYIYKIEEISERDSKATAKVLGIANENPDVNIATRFMNILDCNCECIVNSLYTNTNEFGPLCKEIVEKAKSKEIDELLKKHPIANIYDTFITDSGELPSKKIIHIVMPINNNDRYNKNLIFAFEKVIDLAISNGFKSIAIPINGVAAKGYTQDDVRQALSETTFKYQYKDGIKINILTVNYNSKKMKKYPINYELMLKKDSYSNDMDFRMTENMLARCDSVMPSEEFYFDIDDEPRNQIKNVNGLISHLYKKEDEFDIFYVDRPVDFILLYRKTKGYKETEAITRVFGTYEGNEKYENKKNKIPSKYNDTIKNIKKGKRKLTKYDVYRIAMALKLNFTETIQLMTICNYSFNPISEENVDYEIFNYMINNNGFAKTNSDLEEYLYDVNEAARDLIFGKIDYMAV